MAFQDAITKKHLPTRVIELLPLLVNQKINYVSGTD